MPRLLTLALLACLVVAASASATHQDPQKALTKADNTRARAMLLKRTDLPPGFQARPDSGQDPHTDCPAAVSESDLTLTGEAEGTNFALGVVLVDSAAQVYQSTADADVSWRRGTSAAGVRCVTALLRREFSKQGIDLLSLRKIAFPRVSDRTVAYRVSLSAHSAQGPVPFYLDIVALMHSRAQATVIVGSALVVPTRVDELRYARLVAARMARAMRGA
ncbi:MAG: hypothetical protein WD015_02625 [Gaiellaceae bacterium]